MNTNRTLIRVVLITAAVTVAALGIAALIGLGTSGFRWNRLGVTGTEIDERKTVSLDGATSIVVEGVSDDVVLSDIGGASLEARLQGSIGGQDAEAGPRLTAERSGSVVTVRVERPRIVAWGFNWSSVRLEVGVPKGYTGRMSVKTVSGEIDIADHRYDALEVRTTSGDVRVGAIEVDSFTAHTTSGRIEAGAVTSRAVDISSVSGDVRVSSLTGDAKLHTTSGDVTVTFAAVPPRIGADSTSGEVTLAFPMDAQFQLEARSTSGDITCQFPITVSQGATGGGRHALAGSVGAGTAAVTVRTTSGDIRIEKTGRVAR
jgi:lia operon protein LiaG